MLVLMLMVHLIVGVPLNQVPERGHNASQPQLALLQTGPKCYKKFSRQYLPGCVTGDGCTKRATKEAAMAACNEAGDSCGGILLDAEGKWEMRKSSTPKGNTGETSYVKHACPAEQKETTAAQTKTGCWETLGLGCCIDTSGSEYDIYSLDSTTVGACKTHCDGMPLCRGIEYGEWGTKCLMMMDEGEVPSVNDGTFHLGGGSGTISSTKPRCHASATCYKKTSCSAQTTAQTTTATQTAAEQKETTAAQTKTAQVEGYTAHPGYICADASRGTPGTVQDAKDYCNSVSECRGFQFSPLWQGGKTPQFFTQNDISFCTANKHWTAWKRDSVHKTCSDYECPTGWRQRNRGSTDFSGSNCCHPMCVKNLAYHNAYAFNDDAGGDTPEKCREKCQLYGRCNFWDLGEGYCRLRVDDKGGLQSAKKGYNAGHKNCIFASELSWYKHPGKECKDYAKSDTTQRTLAKSKEACLTNSACKSITCPRDSESGCTLRSREILNDDSSEDCYLMGPFIKPECKADEWKCNNGDCIKSKWKCDLWPDCEDHSDEQNCDPLKVPCPDCAIANQYTNPDYDETKERTWANCCISKQALRIKQGIACPAGDWTCKDKGCIAARFECDQINDCIDNSDEDMHCEYRQGPYVDPFTKMTYEQIDAAGIQFNLVTCGATIPNGFKYAPFFNKDSVCNKVSCDVQCFVKVPFLTSGSNCNCGDRVNTFTEGKQDPEMCAQQCLEARDKCKSFGIWTTEGKAKGMCVLFDKACTDKCPKPTSNGYTNDVYNMRECASDEFKCHNGIQCIPQSEYCDTLASCGDDSDEPEDGEEMCPYFKEKIGGWYQILQP